MCEIELLVAKQQIISKNTNSTYIVFIHFLMVLTITYSFES